jgi:hypothetical protein
MTDTSQDLADDFLDSLQPDLDEGTKDEDPAPKPMRRLLKIWRTIPAGRLGHVDFEDLAIELAALTPTDTSELALRLTQAVSGEAAAMIELAHMLEERRSRHTERIGDVEGSWLLLATRYLPLAKLLIAWALWQRSNEEARKAVSHKVAYYKQLAESWLRQWENDSIGRFGTGSCLDDLQTISIQLNRQAKWAELLPGKQAEDEETEKVADVHPGESAQPNLKILEAIGDSESREGMAIKKAYKTLLLPLPLKGGSLDPNLLDAVLRLEFPWMGDAISRIVGDFRLRRHLGIPWLKFRPILLLGKPGVGKTRFARRLAELMGVGHGAVSASGSADNRALQGTARGWSSAQPALPILIMMNSNSANPVILVDEIDKTAPDGRNGDIRATLLSMLEIETARNWYDEALLAKCDLSQISWILTANSLSHVPGPLLFRLAVIEVGEPTQADFDTILEGVLRDIAAEFSATHSDLPILHEESRDALAQAFGKGVSVRGLKNAATAALSAATAKGRVLH